MSAPPPDDDAGMWAHWEISPALARRMTQIARQLRNDPTPAEDTLWQAIRKQQLAGRKFRRQMAIGPFVVDFYCPSERLAVEVDGPIHAQQREADAARQAMIESLGIRFVRVTNDAVAGDLPGVLAKIVSAFRPHPQPLPHAGGGESAAEVPLSPHAGGEESAAESLPSPSVGAGPRIGGRPSPHVHGEESAAEVPLSAHAGRDKSGLPPSSRVGEGPGMGGQRPLRVTQVTTLDFASLDDYIQAHSHPLSPDALADDGWSLAGGDVQAVLDKLRGAGVPLGDYLPGQIYRGVLTGLNKAFVIDAATRDQLTRQDARSADLIKPFLLGRDVKRYALPDAGRYLILIPNGWTRSQSDLSSEVEAWQWLEGQYPVVAEYLAPFADAAKARYDKGEFWWELRSCDYYAEFEKPKIIYMEIAARGQFTLDTQGLYCDTTAYILGSDSKYLGGLLNSRLWTFMFSQVSSQIRGGYLRWKRQYMSLLPVRPINFSDSSDVARHDRMVALVTQMLDLTQQHAAAEAAFDDRRHDLARRIAQVDADIDALVYELYGLTDAEIAIVEGRA